MRYRFSCSSTCPIPDNSWSDHLAFCPLVILDKSHWMIYFLVSAMYPRFFIALDEELKPVKVTTRVGLVRRHFCRS